jgi:outer membrane immunogenic protein
VNVGGTWDNNHGVNTLGVPVQDFTVAYAANSAAGATSANSFGNNGRFIGGGQFGYNWQFGRGVADFEVDIDAFGQPSRTI